MSSKILVDELAGKTATGNITVTGEGGTGTMQLQQGLLKAWNNINGTGTIATRDSFGISSISDLGTGRYQHSVTNSFSSADYVASGFARVSASFGYLCGENDTPFTSTTFRHGTTGSGADLSADGLYATINLSGDLA